MIYLKEIKAIEDLFMFFSNPGSRLKYLVGNNYSYMSFYKEYVGSLKPLSPEQFFILLSVCDYSTIALAYQGIYNRCLLPGKESLLVSEYSFELCSIQTINLWFNNFRYKDMEKIFIEYPEFGKDFFAKVQPGAAINVVKAHSIFSLFHSATIEIKALIVKTAFEIHGQEANENLLFNLDILKQSEENM